LAAYNSIVARVIQTLFMLALLGHGSLGAQTPASPQPKPAEQNPPEEANPPEEDERLAPRKYVLNPLEAKRCIQIGNEYYKSGKYLGALGRFKDATGYNPSSQEAFFRLGEVEQKLHHDDAAKAAFEKAIKLAPDSKFAAEAKKKLASFKG